MDNSTIPGETANLTNTQEVLQKNSQSADQNMIITILLLVFIYPVGIIFMWIKMKSWPLWIKLLLTSLLLIHVVALVLLFTVAVAINPSRQFAQANNTQRLSDVTALVNAIDAYAKDAGKLPPQEGYKDNTKTDISNNGTGQILCFSLVPKYLPAIPRDPLKGSYTNCTNYTSRYSLFLQKQTENSFRITISAPNAELGKVIAFSKEISLSPSPTIWSEYKDQTYNFAETYPSSTLSVDPDSAPGVLFPLADNENPIYQKIFADTGSIQRVTSLINKVDTGYRYNGFFIMVFSNLKRLTLESYVQNAKEAMDYGYNYYIPGKYNSSISPLTINNQQTYLLTGYQPFPISFYYFQIPGSEKILVVAKMEKSEGSFENDFNQILNSFHFINLGNVTISSSQQRPLAQQTVRMVKTEPSIYRLAPQK